ncbi:MAG: sigma-54-dependent Fis family transcriptional regulator [Pirellulales bacterium]|nr:sigma-54-dependent Fis family transcriptional regulator [Pirellulales bacterium]
MVEHDRTILVVDDEAAQRQLLGDFIRSLGYAVLESNSAEEALEIIRREAPDLVLLDVRLPGMSGIEALPEIQKIAEDLPVLLITAHTDLHQAVAAVKGGADNYLAKPLDLDELEAAIHDTIGASDQDLKQPGVSIPELPSGFVAKSLAMQRLLETIAVVAPSRVPVLVLGPSGSGKEVIAQLVHQWSPRSKGPLVAANCAGLPDSLIESELFGHTQGAFTGATEDRKGLFRAADGGTLFLDEIGELPLHLQPKLLRALESGEVTPVGSDRPIATDTRLIAATNRDLGEAVREGTFREDLYYRINVVELIVPPLSDRREDIVPLVRQFTTEFTGQPARLSHQAMHCLLANSWTGNVRELRNAIQRACLLCRGNIIMPEHLPPKIANASTIPASKTSDHGRLSQVERATIMATLEECNGNRTQAAKKLGISRRALIYKIRAIEEDNLTTL